MTAAEADSSATEPSRSFEIELKYDADDGTPLPDWSDVEGVTSVGAAERRELDARYYDTAEFALASAEYALRRRTGGPDAGWHLKGPRTGGGRVELGWPLGADDEAVPEAILTEILPLTDAALRPIAGVRNSRTAYALLGGDGEVVAEFVDDHVTGTDARTGVVRSWREWEIELGPAAPSDPRQFFAAVEAAVRAAGGRAAASASKLGRTLGH